MNIETIIYIFNDAQVGRYTKIRRTCVYESREFNSPDSKYSLDFEEWYLF